jgi:Mn-dependent DtxR family transcriptional regulator
VTRVRMNEPMLPPAKAMYVRAMYKLRRRLTDKALARELNVSRSTVQRYGRGVRG